MVRRARANGWRAFVATLIVACAFAGGLSADAHADDKRAVPNYDGRAEAIARDVG